ncbi:MAG TPA: hypothetical protein ENJ35_07370 [Gammaproteobacteria bacterium]|nr:hypothetical protein [Gammaproteobacteria bacterium]
MAWNELESAWWSVVDGANEISCVGEWRCPGYYGYGIRGTVVQFVRIAPDLVGFYLDRQEIPPGACSRFPVSTFASSEDGQIETDERRKRALDWMSSLLSVFWMYLTDDEIEFVEHRALTYVMEETLKRRHKKEAVEHILKSLINAGKPGFVSEFEYACRQIGQSMRKQGVSSIAWKRLQAEYPSVAERYKEQFLPMISGGKLTVEQLEKVKYRSSYEIRLSVWRGGYAIEDVPQLVIEVRNSGIHEGYVEQGGQYEMVSRKLREVAAMPRHPGTENTIGWLRIHIDNEQKICFVDEVQSDALEAALAIGNEPARLFVKECRDWNLHGFATVCKWAMDIGYRAAIHSRESVQARAYMTQSDRKWNTYYRSIIHRFGLKKCVFPGYSMPLWVDRSKYDGHLLSFPGAIGSHPDTFSGNTCRILKTT